MKKARTKNIQQANKQTNNVKERKKERKKEERKKERKEVLNEWKYMHPRWGAGNYGNAVVINQ